MPMALSGIQLTVLAGLWHSVAAVQPGVNGLFQPRNATVIRDAMTLVQTGALRVHKQDLWPDMGWSHTKCIASEVEVSSQLACQERAIDAGHGYYQYVADNGRCASVQNCDSPITGTTWAWKVYKMELWLSMGWDHTKCLDGNFDVADQYACQAAALLIGYSYYQYSSAEAVCNIAATCDSPITGTVKNWKVYYSPTMTPTMSPTTASPTKVPTASPTMVPTASPTMVPTASPTMVPTASPTTASPAASIPSSAALIGDPHITSVHGDRFDIHLAGNITLVQIPKNVEAEPLLKLTGLLHNVDPKCQAGTYLTALHVDGAWMPRRREFYPAPRRSGNRRYQRLSVGPHGISIVVVHGKTETGVAYLNLRVSNLGSSGLSVGGLLAGDAPEEKLSMPAECA